MFILGVVFSVITAWAVTITVPTNFTTNTVQYLQKLIAVDSSNNTWVLVDWLSKAIYSDTICDTAWNNCKTVNQLITWSALNGYLNWTSSFLTWSENKRCLMSGGKISCFENTPTGWTSYTLPIANNSILGWVRTSSEITTDSSWIMSIANSSINESKIANNAITNNKIINDAITNLKIVDNAVTNSKIANNAINQDKVQDWFIDLSTNQTINWNKTFNNNITVSGTWSFNNICLSSDCRSTWPIILPAWNNWQIQFKSGDSFAASGNLIWNNVWLGIGLWNPQHKLHVNGVGKFNNWIILWSSTTCDNTNVGKITYQEKCVGWAYKQSFLKLCARTWSGTYSLIQVWSNQSTRYDQGCANMQ